MRQSACSPYVVTLLVSCPQNARVTARADLIFEEYVGLDVHEKFVITKEFSFTNTHEHGSKSTTFSYSLPKEIYVIEDDNKSGPKATAGDTQFLSNSNRVRSSVPSFDLLQEETDEVQELFTPEPGETESKTKTEDMIFDHIRKKSKNFPTLLTSEAMDSSHQPQILTRKGTNNFEQKELEADLDNVNVIDSEPTDTSPKSTKDVSFSIETKRSCKKNSGSSRNISGREFSSKFAGDSNGGSDDNKLNYDDLLEGVKMVGCKRAFPIELDPVHNRPDVQLLRSFEPPVDQREVSFLGFKSVFSFL